MTKKQCLVVVGNIASGKSTVCKAFLSMFLHYDFVCLDDYRDSAASSMQTSGWASEQLAQTLALEVIENESRFVLFETTGTGRFFNRATRLLIEKGYKIVTIHLECDPMVCLQRFNQRAYDGYVLPPFPYQFKAQNAMYHIAAVQRDLNFDVRFDTERLKMGEIMEGLSRFLLNDKKNRH